MGTVSNKSVAGRLFIKAGQAVRLIQAPPDGASLLGPLPNGARFVANGEADVTIFFADSNATLKKHLNEAIRSSTSNLWIAYPKIASGKSDLSRQIVHDAFAGMGWKPVAQISIEDTWSAVRGRPA